MSPFCVRNVPFLRSAPNSPHAALSPKWSEVDGPDLSTTEGELKILAYTVATADGTVRGRHFVLLRQNDGGNISFLNPGSPLKKRNFFIEYRGTASATKQRVFFLSPAGVDKTNQTYELNTIFNVRLIPDNDSDQNDDRASVETIRSKMEILAMRLRAFLAQRLVRLQHFPRLLRIQILIQMKMVLTELQW